jgi:manganese transport protein
MLAPLLGTQLASTVFAVALLFSGQNATLTGTLAGQIVMEGFLRFKIRPILRRLITRLIAIVPAIIVITFRGEQGSYGLLILSQVILSLQLPFAVVPLIQFTSEKAKMGEFANNLLVKILAWVVALVIIGLNAKLVFDTITGWISEAGDHAVWIWLTVVPAAIACALLLLYLSIPESWRRRKKAAPVTALPAILKEQTYSRIGVALDYGPVDEKVISHAQTLAHQHRAELYLFHVVEGVSGQLYGKDAYDDEARNDEERLEAIAGQLKAAGVHAFPVLGFGRVPEQLVRLARERRIDLLVMGGHRHRGLNDLFFGASISKVRHQLTIPVLVVQ